MLHAREQDINRSLMLSIQERDSRLFVKTIQDAERAGLWPDVKPGAMANTSLAVDAEIESGGQVQVPYLMTFGLTGDDEIRLELFRKCGAKFKAGDFSKLLEYMGAANGMRRRRRETPLGIAWVIARALQDRRTPYWSHAGEVSNSYGYDAYTTVTLAYATKRWLSVGVTRSPGNSPTPGRAWGELQPWRMGTRSNLKKVQQWRHDADHMVKIRMDW